MREYAIPSRCGALTDLGLRRKNNEDALYADPQLGLYVVADGMGGRNAGEVAAQMVVQALPTLLVQKFSEAPDADNDGIARTLHDAVGEVSWRIFDVSQKNKAYTGLGATVVLCCLREGAAWFANMGDSSAFLCRVGQIQRLTDEHNVAAALLKRGDIGPEDYPRHPARNVLSRHMGMKQQVYPDIRRLRLEPNDRLILCSDGLTSMVPDAHIAQIANQHRDCESATRALVDAAKAGGGRDNITVVVVEPILDRGW